MTAQMEFFVSERFLILFSNSKRKVTDNKRLSNKLANPFPKLSPISIEHNHQHLIVSIS